MGDKDPRTLVICEAVFLSSIQVTATDHYFPIDAKKSGVKESVFKALEPVSPSERRTGSSNKSNNAHGSNWLTKMGQSNKPEMFRNYKDFFIPSLVTGLQFHRSKLALIGSRGVEIMDLDNMRSVLSSVSSLTNLSLNYE